MNVLVGWQLSALQTWLIPAISAKDDNICDFLFALFRAVPFWYKVYFKDEEIISF